MLLLTFFYFLVEDFSNKEDEYKASLQKLEKEISENFNKIFWDKDTNKRFIAYNI